MNDDRRSQALATLSALYDEHGKAVYRYLLGMLGRREDAEDGVQTVWLRLAGHAGRLDEIRDPAAYLWTVARNHARSVFRAGAGRGDDHRGSIEPAVLPVRDNPGVDPHDLHDLEAALMKLTIKQREMAILVGIEGLTIEEAGQRLGIPQGTAAGRYRGALKSLKKLLGG